MESSSRRNRGVHIPNGSDSHESSSNLSITGASPRIQSFCASGRGQYSNYSMRKKCTVGVALAIGIYFYFTCLVFRKDATTTSITATKSIAATSILNEINLLHDAIHNNLTLEEVTHRIQNNTKSNNTNTRHRPMTSEERQMLQQQTSYGLIAFFLWIAICVVMRIVATFLLGPRLTTSMSNPTRTFFPRRRRHQQQHQQQQFQAMVTRINRTRLQHGERPISADSLRIVMSQRDFNGQDYEHLLRIAEENGNVPTFFTTIGATDEEINRCPSRTLLSPHDSSFLTRQSCSVCLERFQLQDSVRTIPCFHTFHVACIDPWLREKASCPICKHSAIG